MKEKLIEYLTNSKKHWLEQKQMADDALAMIDYELGILNSQNT